MTSITIRYQGNDYTARVTPTDDSWQDAARRAVKRAAGSSAQVRGWILDCWEDDRSGTITRRHYKATICGRAVRGGGNPILGEARVSISAGREG